MAKKTLCRLYCIDGKPKNIRVDLDDRKAIGKAIGLGRSMWFETINLGSAISDDRSILAFVDLYVDDAGRFKVPRSMNKYVGTSGDHPVFGDALLVVHAEWYSLNSAKNARSEVKDDDETGEYGTMGIDFDSIFEDAVIDEYVLRGSVDPITMATLMSAVKMRLRPVEPRSIAATSCSPLEYANTH